MQKTVYICDRCGKESESKLNWRSLSEVKCGTATTQALLCPSCSKRALEKPRKLHCCAGTLVMDVDTGETYVLEPYPPVSKLGSDQS